MKRRETPQARNERQPISKVATKVLAENGFQETTIPQIARKANIAAGSIYDYFNNKEDLLFSIPEEQMENFLSTLHTHLHGMKDALPKLRKPIWCQLDFYKNNQDYTPILPLDLRQNPRFNRGGAYRKTRQYSKTIMGIIEKGKKARFVRMWTLTTFVTSFWEPSNIFRFALLLRENCRTSPRTATTSMIL